MADMHMLMKTTLKPSLRPSLRDQDWEILDDAAPDTGYSLYDLGETRAALRQAETVIQAQEERIRKLEALALTDELTGVANRRGFTAAFDRELALARRDNGSAGILIMIDLDSFKTVNDRWGHQAGDAYLCAVANVLQENIRTSDIVARLGGDEFAILLTHMDENTGARRLARLEQAFNKKSLMLPERVPLRASFGFAPYSGHDHAENIMRTADLRLYAHKMRNKQITVVTS